MTIGIMGSTGQVGGEVARLAREQDIPHRLLGRKTTPRFDLEDPSTFVALDGIERLFLVCSGQSLEEMDRAIAAFDHHGVKEVVFISGVGAGREGNYLGEIEKRLLLMKARVVFLQANWFFQNFGTLFCSMITDQKEIALPDGGQALSFIDARDVAEVALYFLQAKRHHSSYILTGQESLTHAEVAKLFSKHLPYQVSYREITEEEAKKLGYSEWMLRLYLDIREKVATAVTKDVEKILKKPPRLFEDYITDHLHLWV